ncbi:unnamed protein product [Amoebophrya sp. A25]|nr:unnamed protein product [Amoebophrya sp. A25]|eukprot:GSA25T00012652001.1
MTRHTRRQLRSTPAGPFLRLVVKWAMSTMSMMTLLVAASPMMKGDFVTLTSSFVKPLAHNMDTFQYTQVGLCDSKVRMDYMLALNVTSKIVCEQRLSDDQVKALELLIEYEYYVRYQNANYTRQHLDFFLGVKLDNMAHFSQFMQQHHSDGDAMAIPRDFRYGGRDPSKPSYWVYTHKVFVFYFDPDTREILDSMIEVSDLRLVSKMSDLSFRHTTYWLPRKSSEFHHAAAPPAGMEAEFDVHPYFLVAPVIFTLAIFLLVARAGGMGASGKAAGVFADVEEDGENVLHEVEVEGMLFGGDSLTPKGFPLADAHHVGCMRLIQRKIFQMARRDPLADDPVVKGMQQVVTVKGVPQKPSVSSTASFLRIASEMRTLALLVGIETIVLATAFVSVSTVGLPWEGKDSLQNGFLLSVAFSGVISGLFFASSVCGEAIVLMKQRTGGLLDKSSSAPKGNMRNDFFVMKTTSNGALLPSALPGGAGSATTVKKLGFAKANLGESPFQGGASSKNTHLHNFTGEGRFSFPTEEEVRKNFDSDDGWTASSSSLGGLAHLTRPCLVFLVFKTLLNLISFGSFLDGNGRFAMVAGNTFGLLLGLTVAVKTDLGALAMMMCLPLTSGSDSLSRLGGGVGKNNSSTGATTSSSRPYSSSSHLTSTPSLNIAAHVIFGVLHGGGIIGYTLALYNAIGRREVLLALTLGPDSGTARMNLQESVVTLLLWALMVSLYASLLSLASGLFPKGRVSATLWHAGGSGFAGCAMLYYFSHAASSEDALSVLAHFWTNFAHFLVLFASVCFCVTYVGSRLILNGVIRPVGGLKKASAAW